ncbi:MAG: glycerol-3-phosphate 1-O-acyltransferase PlsY [Thermodesulfovibrio sp.]|nr:glycerol-3-phosphate 1-O-acyltransferase PlsY [Thermodesulfovibrio sp.]
MIIPLVIFSFVFGSIPWGYIIGKTKGVDLRKLGSGNIGTTNVMRVLGKKEALLTLTLDMFKGFLPVFLVKFTPYGENLYLVAATGLAAIIGHCFTPFLKFKGGKGVATSIGVMLAFAPLIALITIFIWILTFKISKVSSLSALLSFSLIPLNLYMLSYPKEILHFSLVLLILIYIKHIQNIKRLIRGEELRFGAKR